jgi:rhamnose transport system permease protein
VSAGARVAVRALGRWETLLVVLLFGAGVWSTTLSPYFLDAANLFDMTSTYIYIGLMALGLAFVVIAGEIDISIASNMAVSIVVLAKVWQSGVNIWLASLVALLVAVALGLFNGVLVGILNLPSLAVTLGTLAAFRGIAFVILGGEPVTNFPAGWTQLGIGYVAGSIVPIGLVILFAFALVLGLLLHATRFGRYVYAIGANREAARFSGVPVARVRVTLFALSGFTAGVAGIVLIGFFGSARADSGQEALLDVVTAVVLGGVDIFGGAGTVLGVVLAILLIATLRNGMGLANIGGDVQSIVIGILLLAAILAGNLTRAAREGRRNDILRRLGLGRRQREVVAEETGAGSAG